MSKKSAISRQEKVLEKDTIDIQEIEEEIEYQEYKKLDDKSKEVMFEEYLRKAQAGDGRAQFEVGLYYRNVKKDWSAAMEWWKKSMDYGCADATFNLGGLYYDGRGSTGRTEADTIRKFFAAITA